MSESFIVNAQARSDQGKGASRRLRHTGNIPAVVYGSGKEPVAITVSHNEMILHLEHEAFYSHILTLSLDGVDQKVVLKDLQRHPAKPFVLHADFQRIDENVLLKAFVPLHFLGADTSEGVKQGGRVSHKVTELHVFCLPKDLPEYIEVDMSGMDLAEMVHLSDLQLPEGVTSVSLSLGDDHDLVVASIDKA